MKLNEIKDNEGASKRRMRVGRGIGSGKGKQAGRGGKGQKARTGVRIKGFEGGQMPLHRRLPKRGFNNIFRLDYNEVNLARIEKALLEGVLSTDAPITNAVLVKVGICSKLRDGVRLLGVGRVSKPVTFEVAGASKAAIAAVEAVGGKVIVLAQDKAEAGAQA